ncbi:MAG: GHKL domain-containing protein [Aetokthonos hydrillicola CCALA 1050]|jgi:signal transduction histidine kinase|uniref:sensor histidine kinase n=1 Tax=Aetokthonos hydrillicola TaxID=1550245 RepID=UPI002877DC11|nr:ATP-binding protein [Aetokthonos hydrillicola]MBW4587044.1 GHKL domain-containing protein [Aetokthonos hydrillicola CCALA 1050]
MLLGHRLKGKFGHSSIQVIKEYGDLPLVECFAGQINQVFMNIISNAIDALEESLINRSSLSVNRKINENPTIRIRTEATDKQVIIRISDNGIGVPKELQQKIFDPFFTTKSVGVGTGMGLAISYQIIKEKHGGSLQCVSLPEGDTEFLISIPQNLNFS